MRYAKPGRGRRARLQYRFLLETLAAKHDPSAPEWGSWTDHSIRARNRKAEGGPPKGPAHWKSSIRKHGGAQLADRPVRDIPGRRPESEGRCQPGGSDVARSRSRRD